jgi:4-amino-4-deoxy-L-arabinose transferase-like glycosyltransferase
MQAGSQDAHENGAARRSTLNPPGWLAAVPPEAILVGLGLFVLLACFAAADPATAMTDSVAPFTDEIGNVLNARNFAQLGVWSTDEWNLYLVNLPFSLVEAAVFKVFGVGIVQARLPMILCVSLTATALVWGLRGAVGRGAATFAGLAFGCSGLILFYGRLAFLEDMVVLGLTLGTLTLAKAGLLSLRDGLLAGLCCAAAVGTKPSALFEVVGIMLAVAIVWGWRDRAIRRWLTGTVLSIAAMGLLWAVAVGLPNRHEVEADLQIWPPYQFYLDPWQLIQSIGGYLTGRNDHILGLILAPLIGLAVAGLAAIVVLRKRLTAAQTRLAVAAFAWAAFGFGILTLVSYRPNRYVVPLVPSLAILAAIGLHLLVGWLRERAAAGATSEAAAEASAGAAGRPQPASRSLRRAPGLVMAAAFAIALTPGLAWYGGWAGGATYTAVDAQAKLADAVPHGDTAAGSADMALFLMRSQARTVIYGLANNGDLYAAGARWYLLDRDAPAPKGVPAEVWSSRTTVACFAWRGGTVCLFQLK